MLIMMTKIDEFMEAFEGDHSIVKGRLHDYLMMVEGRKDKKFYRSDTIIPKEDYEKYSEAELLECFALPAMHAVGDRLGCGSDKFTPYEGSGYCKFLTIDDVLRMIKEKDD